MLFSNKARHDRDNLIQQAVFEHCVDAILVLAGAKIIACNEAAVRFGGFRGKSDLLSRSPADMAPELQPDGRRSADIAKDKYAAAVRDGHACFDWTTRRADGSTMAVQVTLVPAKIDGESRPPFYPMLVFAVASSRQLISVNAQSVFSADDFIEPFLKEIADTKDATTAVAFVKLLDP